MNKTTTPMDNVTVKARSSPRRPASEPLADSTRVPNATSTLLTTKRRAETRPARRAPPIAGDRPLISRATDHRAPMMITSAGTPEPIAANMRGSTPKWSRARGNVSATNGVVVGATVMTPMAKALSNARTVRSGSATRSPASNATDPSASQATFSTAPAVKNTRKTPLDHPVAVAHHKENDPTKNSAIAIAHAP